MQCLACVFWLNTYRIGLAPLNKTTLCDGVQVFCHYFRSKKIEALFSWEAMCSLHWSYESKVAYIIATAVKVASQVVGLSKSI